MVDAISAQLIDGFCVGEPWNIQAQIQGYSQVIADSKQIIPEVADKVLATTQEWAKHHPNTLKAIETAIQLAQQDLQTLQSLDDVWQMLVCSDIIRFNCSPWVHVDKFYKIQKIIRSFCVQDAVKSSDFEWIMQQMRKWDDLALGPDQIKIIAAQCTGNMI